ncbi:imm11 family protein [Archangium lansingense]|uniref:Immunity MXAN-0049 protein domain-containing protein n=1 Tax=Archangium lansingense TaxID=2995310 RepID=A0ABT4AKS9_9BACT|nr:DUF1629 domain-containing protein [Archangium lansinium]MCY1082302.1 hypothetical protein [Archangium lansinium]
MNYYVLTTVSHQDAAVIDAYPRGSPADWKFDEGISLAREFPERAEVVFSKSFPDFRKLYDFQSNILSAFIVSGKARQLIESLRVPNAEFLPVALKDHRGNVVAEDYAILNLLGGEDAIDMERSDYKMNHIDKEQIGRIKKLALKPDAISPEARMFRCSRMRRLFLIREDVLAAFNEAGLTGFRTYPAEGWKGLEL